MQTFKMRHPVSFTPLQMFDIVAKVEDYPQFLPLCEALSVKSRETLADGNEVIIADMSVGYGPINETFASKVTLDRNALSVLVEYLDGPFSHLENRWLFEAAGEGCVIDFYLAYEFRSAMLQVLMGGMFDKAFRKFAAAFEARAGQIYGTDQTGNV